MFKIKCPNPYCDGSWESAGRNIEEAALDTQCPKCGYEIDDEAIGYGIEENK